MKNLLHNSLDKVLVVLIALVLLLTSACTSYKVMAPTKTATLAGLKKGDHIRVRTKTDGTYELRFVDVTHDALIGQFKTSTNVARFDSSLGYAVQQGVIFKETTIAFNEISKLEKTDGRGLLLVTMLWVAIGLGWWLPDPGLNMRPRFYKTTKKQEFN